MKNISIIVVIAEDNGIGLNNKLLTYVPGDLKRFKEITSGHTVIMGKNTYFSLPKRPLPNRRNIVISDDKNDKFENCIMAYSIKEAIEKCDKENENFVMGGASIYSQFLQHTDKLYLTKVDKSYEADTFFPEINYDEWELIEQEDIAANEECDFSFSYLTYVRKKNSCLI